MSREEAQGIVDGIWEEAYRYQLQRILSHPFTKELKAGTLPLELIKGYVVHQWHWALEITNTMPHGFNAERSFYRRLPDVEEYILDKVSDELSTPGPGGHQRMVDKLIEAFGLSREEVVRFKCLPECRGFIDSWVMLMSQSYAHVGLLVSESWIPEWRRVWVRGLAAHYGLKLDSMAYFTSHIEADSIEHPGGEAIGRTVMGHGQGNKWVLVRILEEGWAPANYQQAWPEQGRHGVDPYLMWLDALYEHYDPRLRR